MTTNFELGAADAASQEKEQQLAKAAEYIQTEKKQAEDRENQIYLGKETLDLRTISAESVTAEQKTKIEQTIASADFMNKKGACQVVPGLLEKGLIQTETAGNFILDSLSKNEDRYIPVPLLSRVVKENQSNMGFRDTLKSIYNRQNQRLEGLTDPESNYPHIALTAIAKLFKFRVATEEPKGNLIENRNKTNKKLFSPDNPDKQIQNVSKIALLGDSSPEVFELNIIGKEKIPAMFSDTIEHIKNNPRAGNISSLKESAIRLMRMGKLDETQAKEVPVGLNNL